jgi:hypothetical protein
MIRAGVAVRPDKQKRDRILRPRESCPNGNVVVIQSTMRKQLKCQIKLARLAAK